MTMRKISELPEKEFTGDMIDHCFYFENMNQTEMRSIPLSSIFDRIKKEATKSGLTVKMEGEKIMFISKDNNMKKDTIKLLLMAGFKESGKDQYVHPNHGRLFMKTYEPNELVEKIMQLGASHQCHAIKKSLHIVEDCIFEPSA